MMRLVPIAVLAALALGCESKPQAPPVDPAPFKAALEAHMAKQKWEVKVDSFESIDVRGDSASAVVRVKHEESTGLKPQWKVEFVRKGGAWAVEGVER